MASTLGWSAFPAKCFVAKQHSVIVLHKWPPAHDQGNWGLRSYVKCAIDYCEKPGNERLCKSFGLNLDMSPASHVEKNKDGDMQGSKCSISFVIFYVFEFWSTKLGWGVPDVDSYNYFRTLGQILVLHLSNDPLLS